MNIPTEVWLVVPSTLIGSIIGYLGCAIAASIRMRRIQQDTWAAARLFYTRQGKS